MFCHFPLFLFEKNVVLHDSLGIRCLSFTEITLTTKRKEKSEKDTEQLPDKEFVLIVIKFLKTIKKIKPTMGLKQFVNDITGNNSETKSILEMRNIIQQVKKSVDRFNNRMSEAEERHSEIEDTSCNNAETVKILEK